MSPAYGVTFNILDNKYARDPDIEVLVRIKGSETRKLIYGNAPTQ